MKEPSRAPYFLAVAFWIVSFCLTIIAYGTGYWFVSEGDNRKFARLGKHCNCLGYFIYLLNNTQFYSCEFYN